jgi:hypothetical protein
MAVFVRYYQEIPRPAPAVEAALSHLPESWLPEAVMASNGHAMNLMERVGMSVGSRRLDLRVNLEISSPRQLGDTCVIAISWRPVSNIPLLPSLDGDVEISPLGENHAQLAISARYRPPLGWVGLIADHALMRRIAEATVKDFLDRVAEGVENAIAQGR